MNEAEKNLYLAIRGQYQYKKGESLQTLIKNVQFSRQLHARVFRHDFQPEEFHQDDEGATFLMVAVNAENEEAVQALLDADPGLVNERYIGQLRESRATSQNIIDALEQSLVMHPPAKASPVSQQGSGRSSRWAFFWNNWLGAWLFMGVMAVGGFGMGYFGLTQPFLTLMSTAGVKAIAGTLLWTGVGLVAGIPLLMYLGFAAIGKWGPKNWTHLKEASRWGRLASTLAVAIAIALVAASASVTWPILLAVAVGVPLLFFVGRWGGGVLPSRMRGVLVSLAKSFNKGVVPNKMGEKVIDTEAAPTAKPKYFSFEGKTIYDLKSAFGARRVMPSMTLELDPEDPLRGLETYHYGEVLGMLVDGGYEEAVMQMVNSEAFAGIDDDLREKTFQEASPQMQALLAIGHAGLVDEYDSDGLTALHRAIIAGDHWRVGRLLNDQLASPLQLATGGKTPLDLAQGLKREVPGKQNIIALIERTLDAKEATARHAATSSPSKEGMFGESAAAAAHAPASGNDGNSSPSNERGGLRN